MNTSWTVRLAGAGMVAVVLWGAGAGCGSSDGEGDCATPGAGGACSETTYCDERCDCIGCTKSERQSCKDQLAVDRKEAEAAGCQEQFDAALACATDGFVCVDDQAKFPGCESQNDALAACDPDGTVHIGQSPCETAADRVTAKFEACSIEVSGGGGSGMTECTDELGEQSLCIAACVDSTSCDTLNGMDPDGAVAYANCLGDC